MTVYRTRQAIGQAEVAYRESMLAFPFTALRLVDEQQAYQQDHGVGSSRG